MSDGFHQLPSGQSWFIHGKCLVREEALKEIRRAVCAGDSDALQRLRGQYGISQDNMRRILLGIVKQMGFGEG